MKESSGPTAKPKPLKDGSGWYVKVTWPDGRVDLFDKFGSETMARDWIERDLPSFFRNKVALLTPARPNHTNEFGQVAARPGCIGS